MKCAYMLTQFYIDLVVLLSLAVTLATLAQESVVGRAFLQVGFMGLMGAPIFPTLLELHVILQVILGLTTVLRMNGLDAGASGFHDRVADKRVGSGDSGPHDRVSGGRVSAAVAERHVRIADEHGRQGGLVPDDAGGQNGAPPKNLKAGVINVEEDKIDGCRFGSSHRIAVAASCEAGTGRPEFNSQNFCNSLNSHNSRIRHLDDLSPAHACASLHRNARVACSSVARSAALSSVCCARGASGVAGALSRCAALCVCCGGCICVHAGGLGEHDHALCTKGVGSQGPRCRKCTKAWVSERPKDKSSDPRGTDSYLRAAGHVRGPVVGSSPGRRTETKKALGAVTPSVHLGVPKSLAVTPGRGEGTSATTWLEEGVCGTAWSGIWVLKGESRGYVLPSTPDHLGVVWMEKRTYSTAWVTPTHACLCP